MHYKTIALELIRERRPLYNALRKQKKALETMELYAKELGERHVDIMETLSKANPEIDRKQIKSEALELAIQEVAERLDAASTTTES